MTSKKKLIKPIINLNEIFSDDPVRMIRAVKCAAITGFSLPLNLKMKITSQSNLLSSVSSSRLTEEIFKIVHSEKAAAITDLLDKMGLYAYLQPEAASLMRKDPNFKKSYLQRMEKLKDGETFRGQALGTLFYDYLETINEWKPCQIENYKEIFKTARAFVLPMNPPRFEMDHSLKKFLANHNITIKKILPKPLVEGEGKPKKRRKRKRKKKTSPTID